MIRLAIEGGGKANLAELADRVTDAEIVSADDCQAIALLDASPVAVHAAARHLEARRHVMLPATALKSVPMLESLAVVAADSRRQLAPINPLCHLPSRKLIAAEIDSGKIGSVGLVRIHHWNARGACDWRSGDMADELDAVAWLVGQEAQVVYAASAGNGDYLQVHLAFAGGASALIDYSEELPRGHGYQALTVIGSSGAIHANGQQNAQLLMCGDTTSAICGGEGMLQSIAMIQHFVSGLARWYDFSLDAQQRKRSLRIVEAASQSTNTRQAVSLG